MTKCGSCGFENEGTPKFCGKCGSSLTAPAPDPVIVSEPFSAPDPFLVSEPAPAPAPESSSEPKPKFNFTMPVLSEDMLKIIRVAVPAAAAVLLIVIIAAFFGGGNSDYVKTGDMIVYGGDDITYVFTPNGSAKSINGKYHSHQIGLDGESAAILTDFDMSVGGTLYIVSGDKKPVKAAEGAYYPVLSDDGGGVVYFTNYDPVDKIAVINLYSTKSGRSVRIDSNAFFDGYGDGAEACAVSPDGKTVMYARYEPGGDECATYISVNGKKEEKLGDGIYPIAVANNAKYIYYRNEEGTLFVKRGMKADKYKLGDDMRGVFLNKDYSQIVYNSGGGAFISVKGGERIKVTNTDPIRYFVHPKNTEGSGVTRFVGDFNGDAYVYGTYLSGYIVYGLDSFKNKTFVSGSDVYTLNGKYERSGVCKGASDLTMTDDGKWLYYVDGNNALKMVSLTKPDADKITVTKDYGYGYAVKDDMVYYVNEDNELYYKKSTSEGAGKKVDDDVESYMAVLDGGNLYYLKDFSSRDGGTLCRANGAKKKKIKDEISSFQVYSSNVYCFIDAGNSLCDVYVSQGGAFKKKASDVNVAFG